MHENASEPHLNMRERIEIQIVLGSLISLLCKSKKEEVEDIWSSWCDGFQQLLVASFISFSQKFVGMNR